MLHDDVLIENIKYGCVIMQNNGAIKLFNFTHNANSWNQAYFPPSVNVEYEATTYGGLSQHCSKVH